MKHSPENITVHGQSRNLEIHFADGNHFRIPFELLRVYSPSAEVQGHGEGQEILQTGKRHVTIEGIEPVGNYAIQIRFSDGHDTGLFTWDYLYQLGTEQDPLWKDYLERLEKSNTNRDTPMPEKTASACGKH